MKIQCDNCGKEINKRKIKGRNHYFCNSSCYGEWRSKNITGEKTHNYKEKVKYNCDCCKKEIFLYPSRIKNKNKNIFCSKECKNNWESINFQGSQNPHYTGGEIQCICLNCNKVYTIRKYRKNISKYCCKQCKNEHLKNVISEYLEKNNIEYISQHPMYDRFVVDFYLPKLDIIIEVLGDYWHGHPDTYGENKKPLTDKQKINKKKDNFKESFLKENGHTVYMIWERDIYKGIETVFKI